MIAFYDVWPESHPTKTLMFAFIRLFFVEKHPSGAPSNVIKINNFPDLFVVVPAAVARLPLCAVVCVAPNGKRRTPTRIERDIMMKIVEA